MNKKIKGFTLVELLVVVAILGVLAAVGIVSFSGYLGNAKENAVKANHTNIVKFIQASLFQCMQNVTTLKLVDPQGNSRPWVCEPWFEARDFPPRFREHFNGILINPYFPDKPAIQGISCDNIRDNDRLGSTDISSETWESLGVIIISTYYKVGKECLVAKITLD